MFSDTFNLTFGPNEIRLVCGISTKPGTGDVTMEEQVGLVLTHVAGKLLVEMLGTVIADYEAKTSTKIPFDPTKLDDLRALLATKKPKQTSEESD